MNQLHTYIREITKTIGFDVPVEESKSKFTWKNADTHRPSTSRSNPIADRLDGKKVAPVIALCSACIVIACRRVMDRCDVSRSVQMAEALFCFAVDPAYFNDNFGPSNVVRDNLEADAVREIAVCAVGIVETNDYSKLGSLPLVEIVPLIHFTRHILGRSDRGKFDLWLHASIEQLDTLRPEEDVDKNRFDFKTKEEYNAHVDVQFGTAVPFEALNPDLERNKTREKKQLDAFLDGLSFDENPFLIDIKKEEQG